MKIIKDLKACSNGSFVKAVYNIFLNSNFQMIFWFRVAHFFGKIHLPFISKIIMYFHKLTYSVDIDYRATIAGGFKIAHGLGIVIGKDVVIEENVTVYQGVTLGGNGDKRNFIMGKERSQPYIHKGAKLFAGCCVIGPCEIGENSIVAAHAVVTKDVASNTSVRTVFERVETEINV